MKKNYILLGDKFRFFNELIRTKSWCLKWVLLLLIFLSNQKDSYGVDIIPTKGKDFWVGFPYNPSWGFYSKRCEVFITSNVNTSGTISIPRQGWSQPFNVIANVTTTILVPYTLVEHNTSEAIENRGVEILSNDTISVFAISFQDYTADATVIYPKHSLGTEYRISSYKGLSSSSPPNLNSDLLIVATEDATQVIITPASNTLLGKPAGIPYTVNLDAGQSYQLIASGPNDDLTGTVIKGSSKSGSCRPFAVFSGAPCVYIPSGCAACDIIYDQAIPIANWGKTYYAVPFSFATKYTIRILADQNATSYTLNGGAPVTLNAGQFTEINNVTGTCCILGNKPISVIQYMQGINCSGAGDPSMMYLNAQEQKIDDVNFSTVTSAVITQHNVNVIMNTSHISQLTMDGIPVPITAFKPMTFCTSVSYAQLALTQGSHSLKADSGFTAYVYGTGSAESYAYSVGSFSKNAPIHIDSILCTLDTIHLGSTNSIFGSWWSAQSHPNDTIGIGLVLTLTPPIIPDIYVQHGNEFISGCNKLFYFNVEIPTPPTTLITSSASIGCYNQSIQLNVDALPNTSAYTYSWTPTAGINNPNIANPIITATTSKWYTVAVSKINGCANTVYDSIYITVLPLSLPIVNSGNNQSICLGSSVSLSATGGVTYLWSPSGSTNDSLVDSPTVTTNYIVYASDTNGCINSDTVLVTVKPLPIANAGIDKSICIGTITQVSATGGGTYLWMPGGGTNNIFAVSPPATTNYIVEVTGTNGCKKNDTITVFVNPLPIVSAGTDPTVCIGDSVTLIAFGGASYLWSPGGFVNDSITVHPLVKSSYIVFVTDSNGCKNRDTVTVFVKPKPLANAGIDQKLCKGDSTIMVATGGTFYLWQPGGGNSNTIAVSPDSTTNYIVTVSDTLGCSKNDTIKITVNPLPIAYAGSDTTICQKSNAILKASPPSASYLWTNNASTSQIISVSPLIPTLYVLVVKDNKGCKNSDSVFVNLFPKVNANAGIDQTICSTFQANLQATGGVTYKWYPGGIISDSIKVSPLITTKYIVKVTDLNSCFALDTVVVYVNPYLSGTNNSKSICIGEQITLSDSGGVSYSWIPGGSTGNSIQISPQVTINYYVHIVTPVGCLVYDTVKVIVNPLPIANAGIDKAICFGSSVNLNATGGLFYQWDVLGSNGSSIIVSPSSTTNYIVSVIDQNGCKNYDTVKVNVNLLPNANSSDNTNICLGDSTAIIASGGTSYLWSQGMASGNIILVSPKSTTKYIVLVTDSNGCQNTDSTIVFVNPNPVANFDLGTPICENANLNFINYSLALSGSITKYEWNFGDGNNDFAANPIHSYSSSNNYFVSLFVIDNNGCKDTIQKEIMINPKPIVDFKTQSVCLHNDVIFTNLSNVNLGSIQWLWDFGDGDQDSSQRPFHNYSNTGIFNVSLRATSDSGCVSLLVKPRSVEVYPLPIAQFTTNTKDVSIMNPQVQFIDQSIDAITWQWNFGDNSGSYSERNPLYSYNDTGLLQARLIVTSYFGCVDTANEYVHVSPDFTIYFPNAFTPNGDGINDYFGASGIGTGDYDLYIFDRWGKNIFHSGNFTQLWNGSNQIDGGICNEGVYGYLVKLTDYRKMKHEYSGIVSLIK